MSPRAQLLSFPWTAHTEPVVIDRPPPSAQESPRAAPAALLRTEDVATLLCVHPKQVYRLLKRGLPARRVGCEWRFDRQEVLSWSCGDVRDEPPPEPTAELAPPPVIAANGEPALAALLRLASLAGPPLLGAVQADMGSGAELLRAGAVLATACHAGGLPSHLGRERLARVHLVRRELGLAGPLGHPPRLEELPLRRLASRPPTAGARQVLDAALLRAQLAPEAVHQRAVLLESSLEVACAVVAGRADLGWTSRAWAERAGLAFAPLAVEAYGLAVRARDLGDPRVVRLCELAQGKAYRAAVGAVAEQDAGGAGEIHYQD